MHCALVAWLCACIPLQRGCTTVSFHRMPWACMLLLNMPPWLCLSDASRAVCCPLLCTPAYYDHCVLRLAEMVAVVVSVPAFEDLAAATVLRVANAPHPILMCERVITGKSH